MSALPINIAALRRELTARGVVTPLPVCPWCSRQVSVSAFGKEACKPCEAERARASVEWDEQRWAEANAGPLVQHPAMYDCPEAAAPFLVEDEDDSNGVGRSA